MSLPHRKGYDTAGDARHSKAFLANPGATVSTGCPCGKVHVDLPKTPPAARRPVTYTGPDRLTRRIVLERDGYACVCCGASVIGRPYSLQHRKRRSQGGGNEPSNLITVLGTGTTGCHERIDSRRDPADEAKGYTVRSFDDPARVPVMVVSPDGSGITVWLNEQGHYATEPPAEAAA